MGWGVVDASEVLPGRRKSMWDVEEAWNGMKAAVGLFQGVPGD